MDLSDSNLWAYTRFQYLIQHTIANLAYIIEKIDSNLKEYEINERARRSQVEKQEQILNAEREVEEVCLI